MANMKLQKKKSNTLMCSLKKTLIWFVIEFLMHDRDIDWNEVEFGTINIYMQ